MIISHTCVRRPSVCERVYAGREVTRTKASVVFRFHCANHLFWIAAQPQWKRLTCKLRACRARRTPTSKKSRQWIDEPRSSAWLPKHDRSIMLVAPSARESIEHQTNRDSSFRGTIVIHGIGMTSSLIAWYRSHEQITRNASSIRQSLKAYWRAYKVRPIVWLARRSIV